MICMVRKLEAEYRIRWRQPQTNNHRTRYYSRRHHAVRAAEKYLADGCVVEFDAREMVITADWAPYVEEADQSQAGPRPKRRVVTCLNCGSVITQPKGFTVWSSGGDYGHICKKHPSRSHIPST